MLPKLLLTLLKLPLWPFWAARRFFTRPKSGWVHVRLRPQIVAFPKPLHPLMARIPRIARRVPTALQTLRRLFKYASTDAKVTGLVVEIPPLQVGWAMCTELRALIKDARDRGKTVIAYLPHGGGNREAFVASSAERVLVGPQSTLITLGLSLEQRYFKPLLDRLGVEVDAFAAGEFKTAAESVTRETMSEPQREQLEALLGAKHSQLVAALAELPNMDEEKAEALFRAGMCRGQKLVDLGFADDLCYEDELPTKIVAGETIKLTRAPAYFAHRAADFFGSFAPKPYIAVVPVRGAISDASAAGVVQALRAARADRMAAGVLLYVDSPGGSATASDRMHREIVRLKEKKPVVACMGEVAASGGYYVAAPTDTIVASPATITGSIGVVSAKLVARGLMSAVGVNTETLRSAPHADMFSMSRPLDEVEGELLRREMEGFYEVFVGIVAEGRGRPADEIEKLARGRVWAAPDALENGLVDTLGGVETALDILRSKKKMPGIFGSAELQPKVVTPLRMMELPPAEPMAPAAKLLKTLSPQAAELVDLALGPDAALYYASSIPEIR